MDLVLDASVILKWFLDFPEELNRENAIKILELHINNDIKIYIPSFAYYEISHVLKFSKYKLGFYTVRKAINALFAFKLNVEEFDKNSLLKAVGVSYETGLSVYDSYYLTLAINMNCPFITSDERIVSKIGVLKLSPKCIVAPLSTYRKIFSDEADEEIPF